jgi:hypothetical protein
MAKVQIDETAVKRIVKMHDGGDAPAVIAAALAMSVSAVREVLHAKGKTRASPEIRARARKNLARWLASEDAPANENGGGRKKAAAARKPARRKAGAGVRR